MKRLTILILAITLAGATAAQTRKPVAKRPVTKTTAKQPATKAATRQSATTKKVTVTKQPDIVKAVQNNPQYKEVSFTLHGKAHGFAEGEWVKLCEPGKNGLVATDSVQLQGEDFSFKGRTLNVPYLKYLVLGQNNHKTLVEVFIEEGNIKVDITADKRIDKVSGTITNNQYTPYRDSINAIYTQIYNCTLESMRTSNSKEDRESYKLGADSLKQQILKYTYTFARKNLNNWAGIYLFANHYKRFTPAQNRALLAAVPKKYADMPIIADIRKFVGKKK